MWVRVPVHPPPTFTLIGEDIAGAWNVRALEDVATAFGAEYAALDSDAPPDLLDQFDWLVAAENRPGALPVYSVRPPQGARVGILVGSEAKGLRLRTLKRAQVIEIPVPSRNVNCLNVAAAAAVVLHYLSLPAPLPFPQRTATAARRLRPTLLLAGGEDAMELGSVLRSACAFGWERVFLHDRAGIWYDCDRATTSEGRGAARRGRNPLRVIPFEPAAAAGFLSTIICTTEPGGMPLHRARLVGPNTLVVLTDESAGLWAPPLPPGCSVTHVSLPRIPGACYHYRQAASIVLAERARQVGRPGTDGVYLRPRKDRYRLELAGEEDEGTAHRFLWPVEYLARMGYP